MIPRDPETLSESSETPADDTSTGDPSAVDEAADLRAQLGARQEVEMLLAEASAARRTAAAEADDILAQAQRVADDLTEGVLQDVKRETEAARELAAGILAQAKDEAEEIRDSVAVEEGGRRCRAQGDS